MFSLKLAAATVAAGLLIGCGSHDYHPQDKPVELSSYAARQTYPKDARPEMNLRIACTINKMDGSLKLQNFDTQPLRNFDVWVNQEYVLHMDHLDGHTVRVIDPGDLYNSSAKTMAGIPADSIRKVQILMDGKLWDVQGPLAE